MRSFLASFRFSSGLDHSPAFSVWSSLAQSDTTTIPDTVTPFASLAITSSYPAALVMERLIYLVAWPTTYRDTTARDGWGRLRYCALLPFLCLFDRLHSASKWMASNQDDDCRDRRPGDLAAGCGCRVQARQCQKGAEQSVLWIPGRRRRRPFPPSAAGLHRPLGTTKKELSPIPQPSCHQRKASHLGVLGLRGVWGHQGA